MASTVDNRPTSSLPVFSRVGKSGYSVSASIDFSVAANNLAQNETMSIFDIPAHSNIEWAKVYVSTADTDITTVDLGFSTDGSTSDILLDGMNFTS